VEDQTSSGQESGYAGLTHVITSSALYNAFTNNYFLTDDYYTALTPIRWQGRDLYIPELAVGRLVETPEEIGRLIDAYLSDPDLAPDNGLVTGHSFVEDAARLIASRMISMGLNVDETLMGNGWTASQLETLWLEQRHDLNCVSGHFDHYRVIAGDGATTLTTQVVVTASANLTGALNYTLGSHAGLNVPDVDSGVGPTTLDFPQAWAQQGAVYVANTGYGYGDPSGVGFSEQLLLNFTEQLGQSGGTSVGEALMRAKQNYVSHVGFDGLSSVDEKVLGVVTLYGLPMYWMTTPTSSTSTPSLPAAAQPGRVGLTPTKVSPALSVVLVTLTPTLQLSQTANGNYYHVDGEIQMVPGQPVLPRTGLDVATDGLSTHGALLVSASYQSISAFTPLIATTVTDTADAGTTPTYTATGWYPAQIGAINHLPLSDGAMERLVVLPAQYRPQGNLRLYSGLTYEVYYSTSDYRTPPNIRAVEALISCSETR
jgi:hypothetical protein